MTFFERFRTGLIFGCGLLATLSLSAQPEPGSYQTMDYGPVIGHTVVADWPEENVAFKGLAIRLEGNAAMVFDTDLLRYSVATDGGWITLDRTDNVTSRGTRVAATEGREVWATAIRPGWAHQGDFDDPRKDNQGSLPAERGRYRGYYRQGDEVVLWYMAGETEVHEFPAAVRVGDDTRAFVRTLSVGATREEQAAYLMEARPGSVVTWESPTAVRVEGEGRVLLVRLLDAPAGAELGVEGENRVTLRLDVSAERRVFRVVMVEMPAEDVASLARSAAEVLLARPLRDPLELTGGGPARWPEELETEMEPAVEVAGGYVRDRIEIPSDNPWGSWMRLTGFAFFPDGKRAVVSTWNGDVWIVSGFSDEGGPFRWKRYASGMYTAMGLAVVDDIIYVIEAGQLTRLHDLNGNGEADFYESFNNEGVLYPRSHSLCLEVDSEGNFYFFKNGNRTPGQVPDHGALIRISPDGTEREVFASGIRGGNSLGIGPGDTILGADQQGHWTPAERVDRYRRGGFYGYRPHGGGDVQPGEFEPPILWMPHRVNNSAGTLSHVADTRWGPLAGNWILGSYGRGTLFALLMEEIDGLLQGGAVRFPFTLASGPIRSEVSPLDGQLYVAGMRGWGARVREEGSLDRIRYTGGPVYLPTGLNVEPEGIRVHFAEPLDPGVARDTGRYEVQRWQYIYSSEYGSSQVTVEDPTTTGRDAMRVKSVEVSPDRLAIFIRLDDMRPVMQMRVSYDLQFADGHREENEIHHTVHRLNDGRPTTAPVFVGRVDDADVHITFEEEGGADRTLVGGRVGGRELLEANCRACHQPPGTGGMAPSLETSKWAEAGSDPLIRILLQGKMSEGGVMMPFDWMDDTDLAEIVSYIRTEWHGGDSISPNEVSSARAETAGRTSFLSDDELEVLTDGG